MSGVSAGDMPKYILKRNGVKVPFDAEKIVRAVQRAGFETKEFDEDEARHITFKIVKVLKHRFANETPDIEQIQHRFSEDLEYIWF